MRQLIQSLLKFIGNWFFNSIGIYICSRWLNGITLIPEEGVPIYLLVMELGLVLTVLNSLFRPLIMRLLLPLNGLTVGAFSLVVNGFFILSLGNFSSSLVVSNLGSGILATFILALLNFVIQLLLPVSDDLINFSVQHRLKKGGKQTKGIIMMEIDGLSYPRLMKAVSNGKMPFVKSLLDSHRYTARAYDCGVPSQTSSCQSGIMFGRNENICAFRWYDKANNRVLSSSNPKDASDMESMLFSGKAPRGILDNGLSVNNIISGNAEENILTISRIMPRNREEQKKRDLDLYYFALRPYLLTKSLIMTLLDAGREVISYAWDCIRKVEPRINRLHGFYPFVRGGTNILLRDISTAMLIDAIASGRESVYTTFIGYDEIAHHSGPDSDSAYQSLSGIDNSISHIFEAAQAASGRPYELVILSDHGQAFGPTFKQRYGMSLGEYTQSLAAKYSLIGKTLKVISVEGDGDNNANISAALNALIARGSSEFTKDALDKLKEEIGNEEAKDAIEATKSETGDILVLASGNLVNTYFRISDKRMDYDEIEAAYPGMLSEMVSHPGIGIIIVRKDGAPVVFGKEGNRNLHTGEVSGTDPLEMYGDPEKRAKQLRYLADFPNGGDLVIISPVYEDGTVAAYEELIGNHGGLGGEQTDPFLMVPSKFEIDDEIINASNVYSVLKQIKESPVTKEKPSRDPHTGHSFKALLKQIRDVRYWFPVLRRTFTFSQESFRTVAGDTRFNGPAILISLISFVCVWIVMNNIFAAHGISPLANLVTLTLVFGIEGLAAYLANVILRGKKEPAKIFRAMLFTSYWCILWIFILTRQAVPVWILIIVLLHGNAMASSVIAGGAMGRKRQVPVFLILIVLIPLLCYGLILINSFVIYKTGGSTAILKDIFKH